MSGIAGGSYWLTRLCLQRGLGFIYLLGFLIAVNQGPGLLGSRGLLPIRLYLPRLRFWDAPGLLWLSSSDAALMAISWAGVILAVLAVTGVADAHGYALSFITWALLWLLYLSLVNAGQVFYGYGWETLLLEAGFLAIFLGPARSVPPVIVIWLYRWLAFRVMLGAGLIKVRGDECWRDLTCLSYHYETQPLPNPMSWYLAHLPLWFHKLGVLFTHFVELIIPFGLFGPRPLRHVCGILTVLFQGTLIVSGNLSWLNYITIVVTFGCFDDSLLRHLLPLTPPDVLIASRVHAALVYALGLLIAVLSIRPALNLISPGQMMNASFDPLHLCNTYGAFGSVSRERYEIILEGTRDVTITPQTQWQAYEFKAKPGDPARRPALVSPYHYKIDWQMWFAAMSSYRRHPWILNLVAKLLQGEPSVLSLLDGDPFAGAPPRYIRAQRYRYRFTGRGSRPWWSREFVDDYLPPLALDDPSFRRLLEARGWLPNP